MSEQAPIHVTFEQSGNFEACRAAEAWCAEHGISVGRMQGRDPRGLLIGDFDIQKWRNMTPHERIHLDGKMGGDMRRGPVFVHMVRVP